MINNKYRVHEVAKDLGVPSKDVIDLLAKHFETPKKHMTALTPDELNVVFEHYTQKNEVKEFDTYFHSVKPQPKKAPEKAKAPAAKEDAPKTDAPKQEAPKAEPAKAAAQQEMPKTQPKAAAGTPAPEKSAPKTAAGAPASQKAAPKAAAPADTKTKPAATEAAAHKTPQNANPTNAGHTPAASNVSGQNRQPGTQTAQSNQGGQNSQNGQNSQGGYQNRPQGSQQAGRPQGGFNQNRQGGYQGGQNAQGGQGGYQNRSQGSQQAGRPQGGFNQNRQGGYQGGQNAQGGQGGYQNRSQGGQQAGRPQGGFNQNRQGGYQGGQNAQGGQGGYQNRSQGSQQAGRPQGGFNQNRQGGYQGGQNAQGGQGGYQNRSQGAQGNRPQGGFGQNRQGGKPNNQQPSHNKIAKKIINRSNMGPTTSAPGENAADSKTIGNKNVRYVDTRAANVELDKYNERYEQIAPSNAMNKDNIQKKQKLNQRSQRRGRFGSAKRETEAQKMRRLEAERKKKQLKITVPEEIVVGELAARLKVTAAEVIKKLMMLGVMASITQTVDFDTAVLVAEEFHAKVEKEVIITTEERLIDDSEDDSDDLIERSPVVVVMGHVDHGKTSLLDAIRNANVTSTEAGGITQHIGAYRVKVGERSITFLDTPGHAAFTSMRARGAQVTDIAILVVAADDGIMPQTVEAINHAKAAGVQIIVAINKMDKEGASPDRIKQELTEYELVPEEWGGDVICVPVSAKTQDGIDTLLEMVQLTADVMELKANPNRLAKGTVIEAKLDIGRGPVATILIQNGTLKQGDVVIAGTAVGRVRVMLDDKGNRIEEAGPSIPVEITGLAEVPSAGDIFNAVEDEKLARELVEERKAEIKEEQFKSYQKVTLDNLFSQIEEGDVKELPIIVKADVQGSVEAVKQSLEKLSNEEVRVRVIHGAVGAVSESDVMLADASNAIIVGFNVRPDPVAKNNAELGGIEIRLYRVIYDAIEEIQSAMKGMLAPKIREVELGRAEVRQVYKISNVGTVAGCYVTEGKITRNAQIRIVRDGIIVADDVLDSLKRFKDDVKEVAQGYECGMGLTKFNDLKEGDFFEAYMMEEYRE